MPVLCANEICPRTFAQIFLLSFYSLNRTFAQPKFAQNEKEICQRRHLLNQWSFIDISLENESFWIVSWNLQITVPLLSYSYLGNSGTLLDIVNQWYFRSNWKFHAYCCIQEIEIVDLYLNTTGRIEVWTFRHCRVVIWANFFWAVVLWANFLLYWAK